MNGKERIGRILNHLPVDRIGLYEHFWGDTYRRWTDEGHIKPGEEWEAHFGFDISECWAFNLTVDLDFVPEIIEETEDCVTTKDGNGAILKRHKHHDTTPEHIGFTVTDRESWDQVKHLLKPERRRINFTAYREAKKRATQEGRFFVWSGVNVFECMHPVCGHEHMLVGMALDPDWVKDMVNTYASLTIALQKMLFEQEGYPDGIWYYEDMGFKERPFMSPAMYRDIIMPGHIASIDYAHSHGMPVIMHSCGFVEPLLTHMIEAGIDALQVIEVKAGMDLLRIHRTYGDRIALIGGIDVRTLYTNDHTLIDAELEAKIPTVKQGFGFVVHSDHSIPDTVHYETYRYFIQKAMALGAYESY
ncbi:MAG: uroporphyrinogen decarboxylase family protein [Cellulosilyticaceae bacterium]